MDPIGAPDGRSRPRYVGPDTFARLPRLEDVERAHVAVLGVPFDSGVSYRPGARFGPAAIRAGSKLLRAYHQPLDVEPWYVHQVADAGDLAPNPYDIVEAIAHDRGRRPGGARPAPIDSSRSAATTRSRCHCCASPASATGADRARPLRRPPRHVGHLLRGGVHARHAVPAGVRGGPARVASDRSTSGSAAPSSARKDLAEDAGIRASRSCRPSTSRAPGVDAAIERIRAQGGGLAGLRQHRHRRPRPGPCAGHRDARARRPHRRARRC